MLAGKTRRRADLKGQAAGLIDRLSKEKLRTAVDFLTYLQDKEAWEATGLSTRWISAEAWSRSVASSDGGERTANGGAGRQWRPSTPSQQ